MSARLRELQQWMQQALIAPENLDGARTSTLLLDGPQLPAQACLAVYQRSYRQRLRECLAQQFPATRHALGAELFDDFADSYLRDCPSQSYTLYALGRRFPAWLEQERPDREQPPEQRETWIDFMVDLADYEQQLFELFDAPGHEGRPWPEPEVDDSELVLQPCLRLLRHRYPVAWYYHEVRAEHDPALPERMDVPHLLLRRDYRTHTYPLSAAHDRFLRAVQRSGDIAQALSELADWTQQPIAQVQTSWRTRVREAWIRAGFFVCRDA